MPKKFFKPPKDLIKQWPEVFADMYMNTMPVEYLESIHLEFANGGIWEIDVKNQVDDYGTDEVTNKLIFAFNEYQEDISKISFKLDVDKLKRDVKSSTRNIL
jgi:hypothetical protein